MTSKTKQALLGATAMALFTTGCCLVFDARPWHMFGWVLMIATMSFAMDMTSS